MRSESFSLCCPYEIDKSENIHLVLDVRQPWFLLPEHLLFHATSYHPLLNEWIFKAPSFFRRIVSRKTSERSLLAAVFGRHCGGAGGIG